MPSEGGEEDTMGDRAQDEEDWDEEEDEDWEED
jgi:hypothetical protein